MTNHDQKSIIRDQMRANERIIKAASARSGQFVGRVSVNKRMKQLVARESVSVSSTTKQPRSK